VTQRKTVTPVRRRCIQYIEALKKAGFTHTITLDQAKDFFKASVGYVDKSTVKAYFGIQKGRSTRLIHRRSNYPNTGTVSLKTIELSQDISASQGYLELFGLVTLVKRGPTWFMDLLDVSVVSEMGFSGVTTDESVCERALGRVSIPEISLSAYSHLERVVEGVPERSENVDTTDRSYIHTLQGEKEKSGYDTKLNFQEDGGLTAEATLILNAKPAEKRDCGTVGWNRGEAEG